MTNWTKTEWALEATINDHEYEIQKRGAQYSLYCDGELVGDGYNLIITAKAEAEAHAAGSAPLADGVHIDAIAGQQMIDIIKRSFTVDEINKMMEASPYDEPDTGAPEGPL